MSSPPRRPAVTQPVVHLAAALAIVLPVYGMAIIAGAQAVRLDEFPAPTVFTLLVNLAGLALFGGLILVLLAALGESVGSLQLRTGTIVSDLWQGLLLTAALLLAVSGSNLVVYGGDEPPVPPSNLVIGEALAGDPLLLLVFLGPVVWLQAAVLEELTRVFVLTRLWKVWRSDSARLVSVVLFSALFGLAHLYQGWIGVLQTALIGFVLGLHYLRHGRVLPLILAHGIYDTLAVLVILQHVR